VFLLAGVVSRGIGVAAAATGAWQNGGGAGLNWGEYIQADYGDKLIAPDAKENLDDNLSRNTYSRGAVGDIPLGDGLYLLPSGRDPNNILLKIIINDDQLAKLNTGINSNISQTLQPISKLIYEKFRDDFDFLYFVLNRNEQATGLYGLNIRVSNSIQGLGFGIFDRTSNWGSSGNLKSVMFIPYSRGIASGPTLHEFAHNWAAHIVPCYYPDNADAEGHWGMSNAGGQLGGFKYIRTVEVNPADRPDKVLYQGSMSEEKDATGAFTSGFGHNANGGNSVPYSDIELYLMGMKSADDLRAANFQLDVYEGNDYNFDGPLAFQGGYFYATAINSYTINDLIAEAGERVPDATSSQKDFKVLTIMLTSAADEDNTDTIVRQMEWFAGDADKTDPSIGSYLYNFARATYGVGSLEIENISTSLKSDRLVFENEDLGGTSDGAYDDVQKKIVFPYLAGYHDKVAAGIKIKTGDTAAMISFADTSEAVGVSLASGGGDIKTTGIANIPPNSSETIKVEIDADDIDNTGANFQSVKINGVEIALIWQLDTLPLDPEITPEPEPTPEIVTPPDAETVNETKTAVTADLGIDEDKVVLAEVTNILTDRNVFDAFDGYDIRIYTSAAVSVNQPLDSEGGAAVIGGVFLPLSGASITGNNVPVPIDFGQLVENYSVNKYFQGGNARDGFTLETFSKHTVKVKTFLVA
jgi:hypothetical protein